MSQDKLEQEFERYLEGDSVLSRSYQNASTEQAPEKLDDAILAASRRQLKSRPRYAFSPFASDWHVPLSLAAVLVLSVSVIMTLQRENEDVSPQVPTEYQPLTTGKSAGGNFSATRVESEALQSKDRVDLVEEAFEADFDNAIVKEPTVVAPAAIKQKKQSAEKSSERILKREMALPAMRSRDVMSDMPVLNKQAVDSYAPKPTDIRALQEPMFKMDGQVKQIESRRQEPNQKRAIILEKRKFGISENKAGTMKSKKRTDASDEISEIAQSSTLSSTGIKQRSTTQWLITIRQLWADGYEEEAVQELALFYEHYPDYQEEELIKSLDKRLLDALSIE